MLDISKPERYLVLSFLSLGLLFTAFSYHTKTYLNTQPQKVNIGQAFPLVDINKADAAQLERLPGIGPVLAEDIVAYREEVNVFSRKEELKDIKGIGDKKFNRIKDLISIRE